MAFNKLDIFNRALDLTGSVPLNSTDQNSDTARILNRNYEKVLLRCLRRFPWPFAVKRVTLAPDAIPPENEYANQFTLPNDYVRTDTLFPESLPYRIENNKAMSDETSVILRYVSSECLTLTGKMDAGFVEYFSHELALAVAVSLTDSIELRKMLMLDTDSRFREATAISSQEFPEREYDEGPWINAFEWGGRESLWGQ